MSRIKILFLGMFLLVVLPVVFSRDVEHKPVSIAALQEMGMLKSGVVGAERLKALKNEWVDHFGVFVNKEIVVNNRLHIYGGLGGLFQFRKEELIGANIDGQQRRSFFIGPSRTEAEYHFGNPEVPFLKLGIGMFGYKYNPDASNLGEYLFRTGPYPNYIMTGGYAIANNALGYLQGIKANYEWKNLKLDGFLVTETSLAPLYDHSLAFVGQYSLLDGFLTLGAGVHFKRLISVDPEKTSRKTRVNGYLEYEGKWYSTNSSYYRQQANFYRNRYNALSTLEDSVKWAENETILQTVDSLVLNDSSRIQYYTSAGTILMGRFSLDPKVFLKSDRWGEEDLKIFSEAAVLGWKDYPVFYTDRSERIPIMFGVNIPTLKFFELASFQMEYYNSPRLNNTYAIGNDGSNTPYVASATDSLISGDQYMDITESDNWKWSLLLRKRVLSHVHFSLQVARDHLRMTSSTMFYGPQFAPNEYTLREKDWYWMAQVSWGL